MTIVLAILLFGLCAIDTWFTQRRIARYGPNAEINKGIRWLTSKIGPELGAFIGVMVPATALIAVSVGLHLQWVLSLMVGFRLRQLLTQLESKTIEGDMMKIAALAFAAKTSGQHRSLPVAPLESVEPKTGRTFLSGDNNGK